MSLAEYLAWENEQPDRHEFYRGEIFAMVGAARRHARVVMNLARRIDAHLDGTSCEAFAESMKLQLADEGCFYPDLMVSCGNDVKDSDLTITDPVLIVEVLSPSTQAYDRGEKFRFYRLFTSLREYVMIDPAKRTVEVFTLADQSAWLFTDQTKRAVLGLSSIDFELPMDQIFKGLEADAA